MGLGLAEGLVVTNLNNERDGFERDLQREAIIERASTAVNGRE